MKTCCVPYCCSKHERKTEQRNSISFHEFPSDPVIRAIWIKNISREGKKKGCQFVPKDRNTVCSIHFTKNDFKINCKRKILLKQAFPTIFPDYPKHKQICVRQERRQIQKHQKPPQKKRKTDDDVLPLNESRQQLNLLDDTDDPNFNLNKHHEDKTMSLTKYQERIVTLEKTIKHQKQPQKRPKTDDDVLPLNESPQQLTLLDDIDDPNFNINKHEDKTMSLTKYQERIVTLEKTIKRFRGLLGRKNSALQQLQKRYDDLNLEIQKFKSNKYFQFKLILKDAETEPLAKFLLEQVNIYGKKCPRWDETILRESVLWRAVSPKGYEHGRKRKLFKLPSRSTLQRYIDHSKGKIGFTPLIEKRLKSEINNITQDQERFGSLIIDEAAILIYDKNLDHCFGTVEIDMPVEETLSCEVRKENSVDDANETDSITDHFFGTAKTDLPVEDPSCEVRKESSVSDANETNSMTGISISLRGKFGSELAKMDIAKEGLNSQIAEVQPTNLEEPNIEGLNTDVNIRDLKNTDTELKNEEPNICEKCGKSFSSAKGLKRHLQTVHSNDRHFECGICKKAFKTKDDLKKHIIRHVEDRLFECGECSRTYKCKKDLQAHMHLVHISKNLSLNKDRFLCNICGKIFLRNADFEEHVNRHIGFKPFACSLCEMRFCKKNNLNQHLVTHTGEKSMECKVCNKKLSINSHMSRHMMTHSTEKPYFCPICDKAFRTTQQLKIHKLVHTGQRNHGCEICGKRFTLYSLLKAHLVTHLPQRPYQCHICQKRLARAGTLKKHILSAHPKESQDFVNVEAKESNNHTAVQKPQPGSYNKPCPLSKKSLEKTQ